MEKLEEFLTESNAIENEFGEIALQDALQAWTCGAIIMKSEEISIDLICAIHRRLMKRLNRRIAGKLREVPVYIGGECRDQTKEEIKEQLRNLCKIKPKTEQEIKEWHVAFEHTHPFCDGNGRTGRILMNLQRCLINLPLLIIHAGTSEQINYYHWFKK